MALNCKACSNVWKKLMSCILPVTVPTGGDADAALQAKAIECALAADELDTTLAYLCTPDAYNFDVVSGKITWARATPQLTIGDISFSLIEVRETDAVRNASLTVRSVSITCLMTSFLFLLLYNQTKYRCRNAPTWRGTSRATAV